MECIYNIDEFCTNDKCPACADFCPVPDSEGICKYEDRNIKYTLTPKGCLRVALLESKVDIDEKTTDLVWDNFKNIMCRFGYFECDN